MSYTFDNLLRGYRKRLGWDQELLASTVRRSRTTISNWERGVTKPEERDVVLLLAQILVLSKIERDALLLAAGYLTEEDKLTTPIDHGLAAPSIGIASQQVTVKEDWGEALDVSIFYGREAELSELEQWIISERCKLIVVLGMGGIGKSSLCKKLVDRIKNNFDFLFWRDLRNAPAIDDILRDCIVLLSNQKQIDTPISTTSKVSLLLKYLRSNRCLLVLDNIESILQGGEYSGRYREGYEEYATLLRQIGEKDHQSCLVITSREKPRGISTLEGSQMRVRSQSLLGLDHISAKEVLSEKNISGSASNLTDIISYYAGNPLALRLVASTIGGLFQGSVEHFLREGVVVFGEIEDLLDEQFKRLPSLEKDILFWLAVHREPISIQELEGNILHPLPRKNLLDAVDSLYRRTLIETNHSNMILQPVVAEYLIDRLIQNIFTEFSSGDVVYLRSHALMKAQSDDHVRNAQVQLILKPLIKRLLATFGLQSIQERMKTITTRIQSQPSTVTGYVAGNILNLLCQLDNVIQNFDFSKLTVWQAYLRNIEIHDVNFSYSNFDKCVFVETFGFIVSVTFSADSKFLAAGTNIGEILIWDMNNMKRINRWIAHPNSTLCVTFSSSGTMLASSSDDGTARLWDSATGQLLHTLSGHTNWIWSVCFSPNNRLVVTASNDHTIRLWDVESGKCINTLSGHSGWVTSVAFNPEGNILLSSSADKTLRLWDIITGQCIRILRGHAEWVIKAMFSPDGDIIASGGEDRTIRLWDTKTGQCIEILQGHTDSLWCLSFNNTGDLIASGGRDQTVRIWHRASKDQRVLLGHANRVFSVAFNGSGELLASGSEDQTIRLWNTRTSQCVKTLQGFTDWPRSVIFSPNGENLISGGEDQILRVWDIDTGNHSTLRGHTGRISCLACHPKGHIVISSGSDRTIRVWNVATGHCLKVLRGHNNWVASVAFSNDGQRIVSGSDDHTIRLWDLESGQCIKVYKGHTNWVRAVALNPDGSKIVSGSDDSTVRVWNTDSGSILYTLQGNSTWIRTVVFTSNGHIIAAGCGKSIFLWDTYTGQQLRVLEGHTKRVFSIAVSPDSNLLTSASEDQTIRLWDMHNGKCVEVLQDHSKIITSVSFDSSGEKIVSSSEDKTIKIWNILSSQCTKTLIAKRMYENTNIFGATGLTESQIAVLKDLGAVDEDI